MYDLIITDGFVIDGTGRRGFKSDIAVKGDKIVAIGDIAVKEADKRIDATNLTVCAGFIDMHSHSDMDILKYPYEHNKIRQGVTTEITGQCGLSLFPFTESGKEYFKQAMHAYNRDFPKIDWSNAGEFFKKVETGGLGVNLAPLVGHGTLRMDVLGINSGKPDSKEWMNMKALLEEAMEQGALGMSTGLGYPPCCFADTDELIELARIVKKYNGIFTLHMRDQGDNLLDSVKESIKIGRYAEVPVCISHIKASGRKNWGRMREALELIDSARAEGVDVICDMYPYTAAENTLIYELPQWLNENGLKACVEKLSDKAVRKRIADEMQDKDDVYWDGISIGKTGLEKNRKYLGMSILEISEVLGKKPLDTVCDLLVEENLSIEVIANIMSHEDVEAAARYPMSAIGSDAYAQDCNLQAFYGHPRNFGTFPAFIRNFILDSKVVSIEEGIRKITSLPAEFAGLKGRGKLVEGAYADIVILDLKTISDRATYKKPAQYPDGIPFVIVNGKVQVENHKVAEIPCGRVLIR